MASPPPSYDAAGGLGPYSKAEECQKGRYSPMPYPPPVQAGYPPQGPMGYPAQGPSGYPQGPVGYPPQSYAGYPPGPTGYPPQGYPPQGYAVPPPGVQYTAAPPQVIIVQQPMAMAQFSECSVRTICPQCQSNVSTDIAYEAGMFAWSMCIVLAIMGCVAGCCILPFFIDGCQDVVHTCPNCNATIGRYTRANKRRYY